MYSLFIAYNLNTYSLKWINKYINNKIKTYELYRSDQVYKLTEPFIAEYNGCVVFVVCHDSNNAEKVYKDYLKK